MHRGGEVFLWLRLKLVHVPVTACHCCYLLHTVKKFWGVVVQLC